jgi:iron complex transport system substrate-binding protein
MGLGDHVVGVTSYCLPPEGTSPRVVGERTRVSAEAILAVRPDVLLIQQNPDDFGAVKSLLPDLHIEHVRIETMRDVTATIERIGRIVDREELARECKEAFDRQLDAVRDYVAYSPQRKVLFLHGYQRPGTCGKGTFLDEMIRLAGGTNSASDAGYIRYPTLNRENILAMHPEVIVCQVALGQEKQAREYLQTFEDVPAVQGGSVFVVTDRRWTIPSTRSVEYAMQLAKMIHAGASGGDSD